MNESYVKDYEHNDILNQLVNINKSDYILLMLEFNISLSIRLSNLASLFQAAVLGTEKTCRALLSNYESNHEQHE